LTSNLESLTRGEQRLYGNNELPNASRKLKVYAQTTTVVYKRPKGAAASLVCRAAAAALCAPRNSCTNQHLHLSPGSKRRRARNGVQHQRRAVHRRVAQQLEAWCVGL